MRGRVMWQVNYARFERASIRLKRLGRGRAAANRPKCEVHRHPHPRDAVPVLLLRARALGVHRDRVQDGVAHLGSIIAAHLRERESTPAFDARRPEIRRALTRGLRALAWAERENLLLL